MYFEKKKIEKNKKKVFFLSKKIFVVLKKWLNSAVKKINMKKKRENFFEKKLCFEIFLEKNIFPPKVFFRKNFYQILQGLQLLRRQLFVSFGYHSNYFFKFWPTVTFICLTKKEKQKTQMKRILGKNKKRCPSKKMKQQNLHDCFQEKVIGKK